ncbi:MAG: class I SAM-dependent methyltransferase [Burkholderiales bacterium]|nr:class I SAM-dependent methyltransferase [Burkholderiales bacterium]
MATILAPNSQAFKTAQRTQWDQSAAGWNAHTPQIRAWLRPVTDAMMEMARIAPGMTVLDLAAGAGDQTLDLARRVGPAGRVLATDLSPAILELARHNARHAGLDNVETQVADGESLPLDASSFDAAVCRLGLMFFPDPLAGLRELHRVLRPGAGVCTVVFARPENNPCLGILMTTALAHAGLPARDPFQPGALMSLGAPGRLDELFRQAGFRDVASTAVAAPFRLPSVAHYLDFIRSSASPIQQILGRLDAAAAQAAWDEMAAKLERFHTAEGWVGPNELLLTAARR